MDASALADFLKRAATVARQRGGDLRVVGLRQGSLAIVITAIKKSKIGQSAAKEFSEKPIDTTIKASGFAAAIVSAIVYAMSPAQSGSTPLAKAGAEVVENHKVTEITIVTNATSSVVMNKMIASEIRAVDRVSYPLLPPPGYRERLPQGVATMIEDARRAICRGTLRS